VFSTPATRTAGAQALPVTRAAVACVARIPHGI